MDWNSLILSFLIASLCVSLAKGDNSTAGTGLRCKQCSRIAKPEDCTSEAVCYNDQLCSTEEYISTNGNVLYDLQCKQASVCAAGGYTVTGQIANSMKDPQFKRKRQTGIAAHACLQCCDSDLCNTNLCGGTVVTSPKLKCLTCSHIDNPEHCTNIVECQTGDICATERHVTSDGHTYFDMGCKKETVCKTNGYTGSHTNRSRSNWGRKRQNSAAECFECCDSDSCNGNLCEKKAVTEGRVHCLECSQVAKPEDCLNEIMCYPDESCFTEHFITSQGHAFYDLGCKAKSVCSTGGYNVAKVHVPLVGRKRENEVAAHVCEECCDSGLCNRHLCGGAVTDKLLCAKCSEAVNASFCDQLQQCADNEVCFIQQKITDQFNVHYDAGCMHATRCREVKAQTQTGPHTCFQCCNTSYCNTRCHNEVPTSSTLAASQTTVQTTTSIKVTTTVKPTTTLHLTTTTVSTSSETTAKSITTTNAPTTNHVHTYKHRASTSKPTTHHVNNQHTTHRANHQHTQHTTHHAHTQHTTHHAYTQQHTHTHPQASTTGPPCPRFPFVHPVKLGHEGLALNNIGCHGKDNIIFLIDHSHMVSKYDEHEFISFVKAFANTLDIGPNATQLGVAIYNNAYLQSFSINRQLDIESINSKLTSLYQSAHTTGTADLASAIEHATKDLTTKGHPGRKHLIILSRDDINNIHSVIQEARKAEAENIVIDFIGVGTFSRYGHNIYSIVNKQRDAILLDTINELHHVAENLILKGCKRGELLFNQLHLDAVNTPCGGPDIFKHIGCTGKNDISVIVDTSDSITNDVMRGVGQFLYNLVDHMDVGPHSTWVGLMTFNNDARHLANASIYHPKPTLLNIIHNSLSNSVTKGETNTDVALDLARHALDKGQRDAKKYVVLFTDGGSNNKMKTIASALELQRHNVTVIVVGVGSDVDVTEELIIASEPQVEHVVNVKNVGDLVTYWNYLNAVRCKGGAH